MLVHVYSSWQQQMIFYNSTEIQHFTYKKGLRCATLFIVSEVIQITLNTLITLLLTAFQVLNRKLNHLKIAEFTAKLYAPFKTKEEDMRNAGKTAMLLVNCFYYFCSC